MMDAGPRTAVRLALVCVLALSSWVSRLPDDLLGGGVWLPLVVKRSP